MTAESRRLAIWCSGLIFMRLAIAVIHGRAHDQLEVPLALWQRVFVAAVIAVAPVACAILLWTRIRRAAAGAASLALFAGLLFGLYFHFLISNPDHVAHVGGGPQRDVFVSTAALLAVVETAGAMVCAFAWWRLRSDVQR